MDTEDIGDWVWETLVDLAKIAPLGTLVAAIVAFVAYRGTVKQKRDADNRNAWWSRVQWAIDASLSDDEQTRATGMAAVAEMQDSEWATDADQALLKVMAAAVRDETVKAIAQQAAETADSEVDEEGMPIGETPPMGENETGEGDSSESSAGHR